MIRRARGPLAPSLQPCHLGRLPCWIAVEIAVELELDASLSS